MALARGAERHTIDITPGIDRGHIIVFLGVALIVADVLTNNYWTNLFLSIFGPHNRSHDPGYSEAAAVRGGDPGNGSEPTGTRQGEGG